MSTAQTERTNVAGWLLLSLSIVGLLLFMAVLLVGCEVGKVAPTVKGPQTPSPVPAPVPVHQPSTINSQLSAMSVAQPPLSNITLNLAWSAPETFSQISATTNIVARSTNGATITVRGAFTNSYVLLKPVTNYTLTWSSNSFTTTGTTARVILPRGTLPVFTLTARLADGLQLFCGTFAMPSPERGAIVYQYLESAATPNGPFTNRAGNAIVLSNLAALEFFRTRQDVQPLGTNARALAFNKNISLVTETP